ncbi:MAG: 1-deoxy-D-xylulose-5-phosphate synthase [Firmicutes bacterium]|nr:1-deoxy-D-xylulose-5-phosphate synthase [Bacillota bacterium]
MGLLDSIACPEDLKKLNREQLRLLAEEIREELVATVSRNGGHLAPNLGVVELTLALHLTFDSPRDKIIWDVGHQSYVHKLLTGRRDAFKGLRKLDGLSGFPKRCESPHDIFETGHSSTSISAALGIALARDLNREKHHVVAVIGDGALTGGEAFEALNQAGHLQTNLIVVLNDNEMSIANNVGGMAKYLTRLRTQPAYFRSKEEMEQLLSKIPRIGSRVLQALDRVKDAVKFLILPGMLFEELGFTYLGPVDGHNLEGVRSMLSYATQVAGPTLVHVVTRKGKGYLPAEQNPDKFHGIGPFNIETGEAVKNGSHPTYTEVFGETLVRLAEDNPRIVAITAAMASGTGLDRFSRKYPERFFDVGIAEQHAVTLAAGLAQSGYQPVLAVYSTFLQRAYDQVLHDVCMQNLPVTLAVDRAGLVGEDGATHQGVFDISYLRHIPNMTVMVPRDENQLQHCLYTALTLNAPCAVRYPRGSGLGVEREMEPRCLPVGGLELLKEGREVLIIGVGPIVYSCLEAAELMKRQGVEAAVIDIGFIKPLDSEGIIELVKKTNRVVTVEEHVLAGGAGSAVLELINDRAGDLRQAPDVLCLGLPDQFIEHGSVAQLRERYGLTPEAIADKIYKRWPVLYRNGKVARMRASK